MESKHWQGSGETGVLMGRKYDAAPVENRLAVSQLSIELPLTW